MRFNQRFQYAVFLLLVSGGITHAHFPWLATDDKGHAIMWFGETTDDRAYPMPDKVQAIELHHSKSESAIKMSQTNGDDLVGVKSIEAVDRTGELFGTTTYGLYHGMKLTYHVEHLPGDAPDQWPSEPRVGSPLQTIIRATDDGGVAVTVLHDGKPLAVTVVKLFCEEGLEKAARDTNDAGVVEFAKSEVESGLNAVMVGVTNKDDKGLLDGEEYGSSADYLTATFVSGPRSKKAIAAKTAGPKVDPNSGASFMPSGLPDLPEPLTSFGAAIAGEKLYVYGGHTGNAHSYSTAEQSDRFWCLDLSDGKSGQWQKLASGPSLQGLALVAHGDSVIRIGGFTAVNAAGEDHDLRSQTSVVRYDPASATWTDLSTLPEPRSSLDAAVLDDIVYVFGGWTLDGENDESTWHQTAWSLNLSDPNPQWQSLAQPPFQRRAISTAAHAGKLFVVGGMQAEGGPTTRVDVYEPASDSWSQGPSVPGEGMSGFGSSAFATGGSLYVSTMDGFVHRLTADGKSWTTIAKTDPARFFHRMLPLGDDKLVMIGGANMQEGKFTAIDAIHVGKQ